MSAAAATVSAPGGTPSPSSAPASRPRTFLLSCGGTGGHLSPGIALAEGLAARGHRAVLLISHKKVDTRLASKYPALRFEPIPGTPFGAHPAVLGRFLVSQSRGFAAGLRLVRAERPAAIVGFGGFTTASVILAGRLHRVPIALHESNRVPGKAVRHLARFATRVWLPPGISLPGRPSDPRVRAAAMPVRAEIIRLPRAQAAARFDLDPARKTLVVFGGSQGATPLNDWARSAAPELAARGVQLVCVTGLGKGEAQRITHSAPHPLAPSLPCSRFLPFCDDVAALLSAADLVVARAGAGSLAEFARIGVPTVLVPFPQAADDHQRANAAWFAEQGGGVVLDQNQIAQLTPLVTSLLLDGPRLAGFRAGLAKIAAVPSLDLMLDDLEQLVSGTGVPPVTSGRGMGVPPMSAPPPARR